MPLRQLTPSSSPFARVRGAILLGMAGLVLFSACRQGTVRVIGTVDRERLAREGARVPLIGGTVTIRDSGGEVYDQATTAEPSGGFRVDAPRGEAIFAEVTGEGLGITSFSGVSGLQDRLRIAEGDLFGISETDIAALREIFADCTGVGSGGMALGEVRVAGLSDPNTGESPLVTTAEVTAIALDGTEYPACYFDATGVAHDPEAVVTGDSGGFAVFGLPSGLHTLSIVYTVFDDETVETLYEVWVPEGDLGVVPRYPAWVEFPL